ncbi:MAG: hypothetical protein EOP64_01435 [Sphingomonas sp.]|nr:MAG: hypothetical protein EOP64_01435 [Sphingomonas sp.]
MASAPNKAAGRNPAPGREGHVPIADMKRVLAQHPKGVNGLAVPGMPVGSPGMEMPGMNAQPYEVIAFGPTGRKVFARH